MRPSHRRALLAASAVAAALAAAGPAGAGGTIPSAGSVVASGTPGGTAAAGTVRVDADAGPRMAPTVQAVTALPARYVPTDTVAAYAGGGSATAFSASSDVTIAGGTYDFSTYTISNNATVTYSGAVTIRTSGAVTMTGAISTTASGASVTIRCGGNLQINANQYGIPEGVVTSGNLAPVTIDVAGSFTVTTPDGSRSQVRSASSPVAIYSHAAAGGITLASTDVRSPDDVTVRAAGFVSAGDSVVSSDAGAVKAEAYGGSVAFANSSVTAFSGSLLVEGTRGVRFTAACDVYAEGALSLRGFGDPAAANGAEDVVVDASAVTAFTGTPKYLRAAAAADISISSDAGVRLAHSALVEHDGVGDIRIEALGDDVAVEISGGTGMCEVVHTGTGDVTVAGQHDAGVYGTSLVDVADGSISIRATNGTASVAGGCSLTASAGNGEIAGSAVALSAVASSGGGSPVLAARSWNVRATNGDASVDVATLTSAVGGTRLVASHSVVARGTFSSNAATTVTAVAQDIDVSTASISTEAAAAGPSADVTIESYSGTGTIDVTNATIESGDSATDRSGNVSVAIWTPPPPIVRSFILPSRAAVKLNAKDKAKSTFTASGSFDTGSDPVDLSGAAMLTVGDLVAPVDLVADKKGRLRSTDTAIDLQIVPSKIGSSRATFKLTRTGDLSALVDATGAGAVFLDFQSAVIHSSGRFQLGKGGYALGRTRGALVTPSVFVYSARATLAGGGRDLLKMTTGIATNGDVPTVAPDVIVGFGGTWTAAIPAAAFGPLKKNTFTAKNPVPGIALAVLDYAHEKFTVTAKGVDLGAFAADPSVPVSLSLQIAKDLRRVDVRLGHKGAVLSY